MHVNVHALFGFHPCVCHFWCIVMDSIDMEWMSGSGDSLPVFNVTDDLICAARSIQDSLTQLPSPNSRTLLIILKVCLILIYFSTFIAGSFLNIFMFYLIIRYKKLHVLTFGISLQIVVLDLIQLYGVDLFRLITVFSGEWLFGAGMCALTGFVDVYVVMARSFLMCVFVIDRFLSVFAAYFYPRHSKNIAITLSVIAWVAALLFQVPILPGLLDCYSYLAVQSRCTYTASCSPPCGTYANLCIFLVFVPATLIPVVLYALLYWKVKKIKSDAVAIPPVCNRKHDRKSAITFFLLFLTAFVLTSPAFVIIAIARFISRNEPAAAYFIIAMSTSVSNLPVIADPIVIMRHSDVKEVLREIKTKLCGRCGSHDNQNQEPDGAFQNQEQKQETTVM